MERFPTGSLFGLTLFGSVIVAQSYARSTWLIDLKVEIESLASQFLINGYIKIPSEVSSSEKKHVWNNFILPELMQHWSSHNFYPHDTSTYPSNPSPHYLTLTKEIDHLPKIISRNYRLQAVISYLIDPSYQLISFGTQTHWKLKMLASPLWVLSDRFQPKNMIDLTGVEQSWHIVNIPTHGDNVVAGQAKALCAHIDSAHDRIYAVQGLPTPYDPTIWTSSADRILSMLLHQLGILFYCETPGILGINEGATGFYRGSHIIIIEAIKQIIDKDIKNYVKWHPFYTALKEYGTSLYDSLYQEILEEEVSLLAFGPLLHTSMLATSLMNDHIRTISNCKIHIDPTYDHMQVYELIRRIPATSALRQFAMNPVSMVNPGGKEAIRYTKKHAKKLRKKIVANIDAGYDMHATQSPSSSPSSKSSPSHKKR